MFLRGREEEERRLPRRCTYAARSRGGASRRPLCEWLTWFNADTAVPGGVIPDRCFEISSIFGSARETAPGRGGRLWSSRPPFPFFCGSLSLRVTSDLRVVAVDLVGLLFISARRTKSSTEAYPSPSIPLDLFEIPLEEKKTGRVARNSKATTNARQMKHFSMDNYNRGALIPVFFFFSYLSRSRRIHFSQSFI